MNTAVTYLAEFPSPTQGVWHIGPLPIRAYALCILLGIVAAALITEVRLRHRGAPPWIVLDISIWAVPAGIIGARIYHVITSPDLYFGKGGDPIKALYIWEGGLGIWGAVAGGAVGAWWGCRRLGLPLSFFADAVAPGLAVAQAIGRWGNWFNNELFGGHTDLPWGLKVYKFDQTAGHAVRDSNGNPVPWVEPDGTVGPFHPTFLYESIWDLGVALLVYLVDRRWKLGKGRALALYIMAYTAGRFWIEGMRTDVAHHFFGMRINSWVSIVVFLGALIYFLRVRGPQGHVAVQEDGSLLLVTADGTPIDWRRPTATVTSDQDAAAGTQSDTGEPDAAGDRAAEDPDTGDPETGEPEAAEPESAVEEPAEDAGPAEDAEPVAGAAITAEASTEKK